MDIDLPQLNTVPKNSVSSPFSIANIIWFKASLAESLYKYGAATLRKEKKSLKKVSRLRGSFDSDLPSDTLISHDYGNWPLNRGWHLNGSSAVMANASRQVSSFLCVRLSTEAGKIIFLSLFRCHLWISKRTSMHNSREVYIPTW